MGTWLLLGTDSLIACIAIGPMMSRRMSVLVPLALLFGVGDGLGYLLGVALHWSYPDSWGNFARGRRPPRRLLDRDRHHLEASSKSGGQSQGAVGRVGPAVAAEPRQHHLRRGRRRFPRRLVALSAFEQFASAPSRPSLAIASDRVLDPRVRRHIGWPTRRASISGRRRTRRLLAHCTTRASSLSWRGPGYSGDQSKLGPGQEPTIRSGDVL